jgi:small subunit ribosomal protein S3Ae
MAKTNQKLKAKKKKRWFSLMPPSFFNQKPIAELLSDELSNLVGKKMSINLNQITKDFRHQDNKLLLLISGTSGQLLKTDFVGFETSFPSVKRLIRRRRDRIDLRVIIKTKDNVECVIKFVLVTYKNAANAILTKVRHALSAHIKKIASTKNFMDLANDVVRNKLQRELVPVIRKVFPVRSIVVRQFVATSELPKSKIVEKKEEVKAEPTKTEEVKVEKKLEVKPKEVKTEVKPVKAEKKAKKE